MRPFEHRIEYIEIARLQPSPNAARTHSKRQIELIAKSIEHFGWTNPLLIDDNNRIIAGCGRLAAAILLKLHEAPVMRLSHLSEADKRAYIIADNRLAEKAGWDKEILGIELQALIDLDADPTTFGFETSEIDITISEAAAADPTAASGPEDALPPVSDTAVTQEGDIWLLGRHRLMCGDALNGALVDELCQNDQVDVVFIDPPYNVPIIGHVRKEGHREFLMASGEMTDVEFAAFLVKALVNARFKVRDGAIGFVCIDWRHVRDVLNVGRTMDLELKNICVWEKTNGGMGSLYRSQHELVVVFKLAPGPHINNIQLGATGRNRTNIWRYASVNSFKSGRDEELAMHPTCKPVLMVQHAIEDVSKRNEIVLDTFGGSGTTLIAAEKCGRRARVMELDPLYCDVILRRYAAFTGKAPTLMISGETFDDVATARATAAAEDF